MSSIVMFMVPLNIISIQIRNTTMDTKETRKKETPEFKRKHKKTDNLMMITDLLLSFFSICFFLVNFHRDKQMNERCDLNTSANKKNEMRECSGGGPVNQKRIGLVKRRTRFH